MTLKPPPAIGKDVATAFPLVVVEVSDPCRGRAVRYGTVEHTVNTLPVVIVPEAKELTFKITSESPR